MGVQIDLIIPPVIIGLLIILIFRVNAFMVESSIDNRLNNDMQEFADLTGILIQEELRTLSSYDSDTLPDTTLRFVNLAGDSVFVNKNNRNLEIVRVNPNTMASDTTMYPSHLQSLYFTAEPDSVINPHFIRIRIETESQSENHARFRNHVNTVKAFSEKQIFLRNLAASTQ
jgi:hypothetical protein